MPTQGWLFAVQKYLHKGGGHFDRNSNGKGIYMVSGLKAVSGNFEGRKYYQCLIKEYLKFTKLCKLGTKSFRMHEPCSIVYT